MPIDQADNAAAQMPGSAGIRAGELAGAGSRRQGCRRSQEREYSTCAFANNWSFFGDWNLFIGHSLRS